MGSFDYPLETREKKDIFVYNVDTGKSEGFEFNQNTADLPYQQQYFPCTRVKPDTYITAESKSSKILMYNHGERNLSCIGNLKELSNPESPELKMTQDESSSSESDLRMDLSDDSYDSDEANNDKKVVKKLGYLMFQLKLDTKKKSIAGL